MTEQLNSNQTRSRLHTSQDESLTEYKHLDTVSPKQPFLANSRQGQADGHHSIGVALQRGG